MVEVETAVLISLNKERKNKAKMPHWDKGYKRPTPKYTIPSEIIADTLLTEKEVINALNSLEAQGKVGSELTGSKMNKFFWWFLKWMKKQTN